MKILIGGAAGYGEVPGLKAVADRHEITFAPDDAALKTRLPTTEVFVSWSFRGSGLEQNWALAKNLKWVHWCGAGVKPALFDDLVASDVVLTNARGIFDQAMAEYVLGLLLAFGLGLPQMLEEQRAHRWTYRQSELVAGTRAVVFGVGGIGQRIGELLKAAGISVKGVGRRPRATSTVFGHVLGREHRLSAIAEADWIIAVMPETSDTDRYFGIEEFAAMRPSARFINVGRGNSVDEAALLAAIEQKRIAGAALDVFQNEPLPKYSQLWSTPGVIVSPHVSGDFKGFEAAICAQFLENLERYSAGRRLLNIVDKHAGYVIPE
jgi:phosphoglycerate dehydrogenase-like enzyme